MREDPQHEHAADGIGAMTTGKLAEIESQLNDLIPLKNELTHWIGQRQKIKYGCPIMEGLDTSN